MQVANLQTDILSALTLAGQPLTVPELARRLGAATDEERQAVQGAAQNMRDIQLLTYYESPYFEYQIALRGRERVAQLASLAIQAIAVIGALECPACPSKSPHLLIEHANEDGCARERGDIQVQEVGAVAQGPCGCKCDDMPDLQAAVAWLKKVGRP